MLLVKNPMTVINDGVGVLEEDIRYFFFAVVVALVVQPVVRQLTLDEKVRCVGDKYTRAATEPMQNSDHLRHNPSYTINNQSKP